MIRVKKIKEVSEYQKINQQETTNAVLKQVTDNMLKR